MRPAIVISSFTMGLGVIRGLGSGGVPVIVAKYDPADMGHVSRHVREVVDVPHPAIEEEAFVRRLVEIGPRYDRGLLVPASDAALVAVSKHKALLEEHYVVAATDWDTTRLLIEKRETYALADSIGVPAPKTLVPRDPDEVERYAESALYPCLVKPSQGHLYKARFGTKMVQVDDPKALIRAYREAADADLEVMLQELIPGPDGNGANYNSYMWDGQPLVEFTARKVRGSPPDLGSPRVARSELVPEVIEPGRAILRAMNFEGFSCTEFKRDERDGVWKLMEVNGRANLSGSLAVRCGVNFPLLQYEHLMNDEIPKVDRFETGVYWIDLVRDMGCNVGYARRERYRVRELVEPYRRRHVFAIWDPRDPRPFLVRIANLARSALAGLARRVVSLTGRSDAEHDPR
jgi:D-aspartate ligase